MPKNKRIITVALTGSQGSKQRNKHTPITPDEIIESAFQCYQAGASIAHIHVKDEDGNPSIDLKKFNYIKNELNKKCDLIINFTTSGEYTHHEGLDVIGTMDAYQEKRVGVLDLQPDIATYDIPTMNFGEKIFMNPLPFLRNLGVKMQELAILPEIEIYNAGDFSIVDTLKSEDVLPEQALYQFCLGIQGGTSATVTNLAHLISFLSPEAQWSAFGVGKNHLKILYAAIALGGHVRVGLEDNIYYEKGQLATNTDLVKRAARLIREYGCDVATPQEAREILGIPAKKHNT